MKTILNSYTTVLVFLTCMIGNSLAFSADASTCTIRRDVSGNPPMSWDNGDNVTQTKSSIFNSESCDVPAGSIITNVRATLSSVSNPAILTNGLLYGDYTLIINANSTTAEIVDTVSAQNVLQISTSGNISSFNGLDLHDTNFNLSGQLRNSLSLTCNNATPSKCEDYMYFEYTLSIDYEAPTSACLSGTLVGSYSGNYEIINVGTGKVLSASSSSVTASNSSSMSWSFRDSDSDGVFAIVANNSSNVLKSNGLNSLVDMGADIWAADNGRRWVIRDSNKDGIYGIVKKEDPNSWLEINPSNNRAYLKTSLYSQPNGLYKICEK